MPSGRGGGRMLGSHAGPAGAGGALGARLALGWAALRPLVAAMACAAAGLPPSGSVAAAASGGAAALRLGAL